MSGWKTYLAASGLVILGIVSVANGDVAGGVQQFLAALAAAGLRHAIAQS